MSWVQYQRESAFTGMGHASIYLGHLLLRMGHAHASEITTMRCGPQLARTQTMHRRSPPRRRQRRRQQIRRCPHAVRWTAQSSTEAGGALRAGYARALGRQWPSLGGEDTGRGPVRPGDAVAARRRVARSAACERRPLLPLAGMHGAQLPQCCVGESSSREGSQERNDGEHVCIARSSRDARTEYCTFESICAGSGVPFHCLHMREVNRTRVTVLRAPCS